MTHQHRKPAGRPKFPLSMPHRDPMPSISAGYMVIRGISPMTRGFCPLQNRFLVRPDLPSTRHPCQHVHRDVRHRQDRWLGCAMNGEEKQLIGRPRQLYIGRGNGIISPLRNAETPPCDNTEKPRLKIQSFCQLTICPVTAFCALQATQKYFYLSSR